MSFLEQVQAEAAKQEALSTSEPPVETIVSTSSLPKRGRPRKTPAPEGAEPAKPKRTRKPKAQPPPEPLPQPKASPEPSPEAPADIPEPEDFPSDDFPAPDDFEGPDDFDEIFAEREREIETPFAAENFETVKRGGKITARRDPLPPDARQAVEEMRADPERAAEADEFERELEREYRDDDRFDRMAGAMSEDVPDEDEWMSAEDRRKVMSRVVNLSKMNGAKVPKNLNSMSNGELLSLCEQLRGNQKQRLFQGGVKKAYFGSLALVEALGPMIPVGEAGLEVQGLSNSLEGDSYLDEVLEMVAADLEEQYSESVSPLMILGVITAKSIAQLHAANASLRRAAKVASPELVSRLNSRGPPPPLRSGRKAAEEPAKPAPAPEPAKPAPPPEPAKPAPAPEQKQQAEAGFAEFEALRAQLSAVKKTHQK